MRLDRLWPWGVAFKYEDYSPPDKGKESLENHHTSKYDSVTPIKQKLIFIHHKYSYANHIKGAMILKKYKLKKIGILAFLGSLALSGCSTENINNSSMEESAQTTAPTLRQYKPITNEDEALENLSSEQFKSYYDIICHQSSFREFSEIEKSPIESPQEKENNYKYINDAPDVVRQISDRNKNQVASSSIINKPQPARCQEKP